MYVPPQKEIDDDEEIPGTFISRDTKKYILSIFRKYLNDKKQITSTQMIQEIKDLFEQDDEEGSESETATDSETDTDSSETEQKSDEENDNELTEENFLYLKQLIKGSLKGNYELSLEALIGIIEIL